ncbi:RnaseH-domain-containing protein [Penicillium argentinense]|uniref:RnaseH-domain-containing protein n=1 Tax=Penicillium argentinense TaxID=1131581 RepID=A0A9W9EYC1_9EURO|nr:RnaseH-domain-containing protein [Penicillium argentinense]KAJ5090243.1 RnaseH-domain-containing protein [Penicillium argentinense]
MTAGLGVIARSAGDIGFGFGFVLATWSYSRSSTQPLPGRMINPPCLVVQSHTETAIFEIADNMFTSHVNALAVVWRCSPVLPGYVGRGPEARDWETENTGILETEAVSKALELTLITFERGMWRPKAHHKVTVFTDSLNVHRRARKCRERDLLMLCSRSIQLFNIGAEVEVRHCPGHYGVLENEVAYEIAGTAASYIVADKNSAFAPVENPDHLPRPAWTARRERELEEEAIRFQWPRSLLPDH